MNPPNYKDKQKELTELNSDGNEDRGRDGEDLTETEKEIKKQAQDPRHVQ